MADREHTSTHHNQLLGTLKQKLLLMSYEAERMISDCIRSLVDRRPSLAEQVIHRDDVVDKLEIEIDDLGYEILALEQPVACDFRFIATSLKIVKDIERIGDTAVNIASFDYLMACHPACSADATDYISVEQISNARFASRPAKVVSCEISISSFGS